MTTPEHTQELLLLALAEPPFGMAEGAVRELRDLAELPPAAWRRHWRRDPRRAATVADLCQEYISAHPDDVQSRRSRVIAASLSACNQIGRVFRDAGPALSPEALAKLEDFCVGLESCTAALREELGLAPVDTESGPQKTLTRFGRGPRAPRGLPASAASRSGALRRSVQLAAAHLQVGLEYPDEAYPWKGLSAHLLRQMPGPSSHLVGLGRVLRVAFCPDGPPQEVIRLRREGDPGRIARLAEWAAELVPRAPEDFAWPCEGGSDCLAQVLRNLSLCDLLAAREVSAAWETASRMPLREALKEQAEIAELHASRAPRGRALGAAGVFAQVQRFTLGQQEGLLKWHRRIYGSCGPRFAAYVAGIRARAEAGPDIVGSRLMARAVALILEEVPGSTQTSLMHRRAWQRLEDDLETFAARAAVELRRLFGEPAALGARQSLKAGSAGGSEAGSASCSEAGSASGSEGAWAPPRAENSAGTMSSLSRSAGSPAASSTEAELAESGVESEGEPSESEGEGEPSEGEGEPSESEGSPSGSGSESGGARDGSRDVNSRASSEALGFSAEPKD